LVGLFNFQSLGLIVELFDEFPSMGRTDLRDLKKGIDFAFRDFSRENGEAIENFFDPLMYFMVWFEKLLLAAPWPIMIIIFAVLAWLGARSIPIVIGTVASFLTIGYFGMWEDTMATVAIISVATALCIGLGIPLGILMSRSNRMQSVVTPVLDIMQTIPSFVYLIPVVMLLVLVKCLALLLCVFTLFRLLYV